MARIVRFENKDISVPDDATDAEIAEIIGGSSAQVTTRTGQSTPTDTPWANVAANAVNNFLPSVGNVVKGFAEAITSPKETAQGVIDIAAGGFQNILPRSVVEYINKKFPSESAEEARVKADAVGAFFANRYGSMEGFKKALGKDPAGVMADAATIITGVGGVAKLAGLPSVAAKLSTTANAIDPIYQTIKGVKAVANPMGKIATDIVGGIGTHTGGESIRQMVKVGMEGGDKARVATSQLRETSPITDLLSEAETALSKIKQQRSAEYSNAMRGVASDKTILNFNDIDSAVNSALSVKQFKGKSISPSTAKIQQDLLAVVDDWKNQNPADFHTAEGLDALKQTIGDIRDATEYGTPSRKVADMVYDSVKSEIVKQAPEYSKIMKDYSEASELISEIQRHLLGKEKGSPITAVRKLQSLMTAGGKNKSMEMTLAKQLEAAGATNLLPGLAGVSMQGWAPRVLSGRLGAGIGTAVVAANNPAIALGLLPLQSPRLVGEAAILGGRGAGAVSRTAKLLRSGVGGTNARIPYGVYGYEADQLARGMLTGEEQ